MGSFTGAGADEGVSQRHRQLVETTRQFVKLQLESCPRDGSHDYWHIERVHAMAVTLAKGEGLTGETLLAVEMAALLHDVQDWKYAATKDFDVKAFLDGQDALEASTADTIQDVIAKIGFKDELAGKQGPALPELAVVQDADRLDAIGAVGIARCFTFGGKFGRVLHDPGVAPRTNLTAEEYKSGEATTLNHFYEKLLKLKGMMKTKAGKEVAESRHAFLETYLDQFHREWRAEA
jgi:uncharacterized protein